MNEKASFREVVKIVRWCFGIAWKYERKLVTWNFILNALLSIFVFLQFASFSQVIDEVIRMKELGGMLTKSLVEQTAILIGTFLLPLIFRTFEIKNQNTLRPKFFTHLQQFHIEHLSKLDIATIENPDFQKKLTLANEWGIGSISNVFFNSIDVFKTIISLLMAAAILIFIKPVLVVLAVVGALPSYFSEEKYGRMLFRAYMQQTDDTRTMQDRRSFFYSAQKMIEIFIFNIGNLFRNQLLRLRNQYDKKIIAIGVKRANASFLTDIISLVALVGAIALIVHDGVTGAISIGALALAFSSYRNFGTNTTSFFYALTRVQEQVRFAIRWYEIYSIKPVIVSKEDALRPDWKQPPAIEFKNVSFSYPHTNRMVLKDINLAIPSGETLALVGLNGAGKTTLIKLLARIYDPDEGAILIDDVDLKDIDIDWWRANLGILFQNFSNFQMTVRESITISRSDKPVDEEKMERAARDSGAIDFIKDFPKQYDQIIWKGFQDGVELSQGQHQRMAVARILYRDALVSILDEPTSAIDAVAEEKIFEVLETKMKGRTVILISHRFSTVKNANNIAVVEEGEIKELGTHKSLMKKNGRYAELYNMQAKRYLEE